jgi:uncharacterized protein involved in exopolysaccharide biosynthesis
LSKHEPAKNCPVRIEDGAKMTMAGRAAVDPEDAFGVLAGSEELIEEDPRLFLAEPGGEKPQEPLWTALGRVFRTYRTAYVRGVLAVTLASVLVVVLLPARYRATGTLMTAGSGLPQGALSRLARLTMFMPSRRELPPEIIVSLLASRRISDAVLERAFERWPGDPERLRFKDILTGSPPGKEPRERLYAKLGKATSFLQDPETRIVTVAVETRYPHLSAQVVNAYLDLLSRTALEDYQARSGGEARYLGQRIAEVRDELGDCESRLHAFYLANQNYATSSDPDIRIEELRLQRDVELKTRVMAELVTQQEAALVEERNTSPFVHIIDRGVAPEVRSWPQRKLFVVLAFAAAAAVGFALMLAADHLRIRSLRGAVALARSA